MKKMRMETENLVDENIKKLMELFPSVVTETVKDGKVERAVDFDALKQELSDVVVEENKERYQFNWPDKRASRLLANSSVRATLRPCKEESVDFDTTQNLYIEGDNLDVLKLMRETYLGKIKMIYIDPPYNTGNDFIYEDDFAMSVEEYNEVSGEYDDQGNRLVQNSNSNGRFHTDWLNMLYPRIKVSRELLTDDGVIFISIDDNEVANLKKLCDEVYGEQNFLGLITWSKKRKGSFLSKGIISLTEYVAVYAKNLNKVVGLYGGKANESESQPIIKRTNNISELAIPSHVVKTKLADGVYKAGNYGDGINPVTLLDDVHVNNGYIENEFRIKAPFIWSQQMFNDQLRKGATFVINTINFQIRAYKVQGDDSFKGFPSYINGVEIKGTNEDAYEELERIFSVKNIFGYSKPVNYIKNFIQSATHFDKDAIILDFFSGSSTTAHAVMQLNAEDGGNRKFIMVQLPETCAEDTEAYKAGFKNICEIGKERIRKVGKKLTGDSGLITQNLDVGFRVLKLDSTNMKDVYYKPDETSQQRIDDILSNVKEDRTSMDLLFQVMLEKGKLLSSKIEEKVIEGKKVYVVNDNDIICCFDKDIGDDVVKSIAQLKPLFAVFRDSSFKSDDTMVNAEQYFRTYSSKTELSII